MLCFPSRSVACLLAQCFFGGQSIMSCTGGVCLRVAVAEKTVSSKAEGKTKVACFSRACSVLFCFVLLWQG